MQVQNLRKGPWFEEEDEQLTTIVGLLGERRWDALAETSGLRRTGKSCRLRWMNYLRPNLKHGQISEEEEQIIAELHQQWGNKWSRIARRLPGRTDNEVKNYWRSHLRRKLQVQQEQEDLGSALDKGNQNLSVLNCEGITESANNGDCMLEKDVLSGSSVDSSSAFELSNLTFPDSPYDYRLSDWISSWSNDQSTKKHHEQNCSSDDYYLAISGESDYSMCGFSSSIWNMD